MVRHALTCAVLLGGLVSCTPTTEIYGANGQKQELIECHGIMQSMAACYRKAGEVCPHGYLPVGSGGEAYPVAGSVGSASFSANQTIARGSAERIEYAGTAVFRYLTVQCNP